MTMKRCGWVPDRPLYVKYHDEEWGAPVHDDRKLFEQLVLQSMQAGLSWETILKKRENFREAFDNFDFEKVAKYDSKKFQSLMKNEGIVRNKLKIKSAIENAKVYLRIRKEYDSFEDYIWSFVNGKQIVNKYKSWKQLPAKTELSDKISKDLKQKGMNFVGSTIIYAYMQAVGIVNDHETGCYRRKEL
ncbi:DNA-3-methyladenine glycosylase I [Candidatus Altiarchaeota archaeon]